AGAPGDTSGSSPPSSTYEAARIMQDMRISAMERQIEQKLLNEENVFEQKITAEVRSLKQTIESHHKQFQESRKKQEVELLEFQKRMKAEMEMKATPMPDKKLSEMTSTAPTTSAEHEKLQAKIAELESQLSRVVEGVDDRLQDLADALVKRANDNQKQVNDKIYSLTQAQVLTRSVLRKENDAKLRM
ncbi:unnamed protein product, partial [Amoebophrya sp. A120]